MAQSHASARNPGSARDAKPVNPAGAFVIGALVTLLAFVAHLELGVPSALGLTRLLNLDMRTLGLGGAMLGGLLAMTKLRGLVWLNAWLALGLYALVAFTPLPGGWIRDWSVGEEPKPADAIVLLSGENTQAGTVELGTLRRVTTALDLAERKLAPVLVRTTVPAHLNPTEVDTDRLISQTQGGFRVETVGPVESTRDEATAVRAMADKQGWKKIILVTGSIHLRRSAETFRRVGLDVIPVASDDRASRDPASKSPSERLDAFREWLPEWTAMRYYQARGWL